MRTSWLSVFIMLTQLDGNPIWVDGSQVAIIRPPFTQCPGSHGAAIKVGATGLCVKETPDQIREKIDKAMKGE